MHIRHFKNPVTMNGDANSLRPPDALRMSTSMAPEVSNSFAGEITTPSAARWLVEGTPASARATPIGGSTKRALDILVAGIALVLALPMMILVALFIKFTTGGSAIYLHRRIGFRGQAFNCYKFRTMVPNADVVLRQYLAVDPMAAAEWAARRKLSHDPRITFLGRILRASSIDELPQLVNVLRGDMSCVGPRPIVADELELYGDVAPYYLQARPGLTGLWQISGRDHVSYARRVQLDLAYLTNWSLGKDALILLRTIFVLLKTDDAS